MVELTAGPEEEKQRIEQLGTADLLIGLVDEKAGDSLPSVVATIREGLAELPIAGRTAVVLRREPHASPPSPFPEEIENESLRLATYSLPTINPSVTPVQTIASAYRAIWNISARLNCRACVVIASSVEALTAQWIAGLVQPILEHGFDLVAPCYARHKFEGLLNSAILYPLTRALS